MTLLFAMLPPDAVNICPTRLFVVAPDTDAVYVTDVPETVMAVASVEEFHPYDVGERGVLRRALANIGQPAFVTTFDEVALPAA